MSGRRPWFARCAIFVWSAGWLAVSGCGQEAPPPELPPRSIAWQRVSGSLAVEQRVISGIVTSVDETSLAFEVGGTVKTVEVRLGDIVTEGQVLARLDPEPFELTVSDAEAALAEATAIQQAARAEYARTKELFEADVTSRQEYDRSLAMRDSRDGQVDAARARLNLAKRDLRRSVLKAPFSGAISVRDVEPAMEVSGGQVVFEMDSKESGLQVEVQMPETLIGRVRQGAEVEVGFPSLNDPRFEGDDQRYEGVVTEVGTRAGAGNAFPVKTGLREPPPGVRPGMTAEVFFKLESAAATGVNRFEGFMIPMAAALPEPENRFAVFVYDRESSTVSKRGVRTGGVRDNHIAVLEGLSEGEIIATAGVPFLRDGQTVRLLDERVMRTVQ
ncbi:MAG: efflux RND transporter periplasmic adaptor subunit [Myxococcota bacterium]